MKTLIALLSILVLLGGCANLEGLAETPEFKYIRMWDRLTPDPSDFTEFMIPGWMPNFYEDYFNHDTTTVIPFAPYTIIGIFCNKQQKDRDENGVLLGEWYGLVFQPQEYVRDSRVLALQYYNSQTEIMRFYVYDWLDQETPGKPREVTEEEFNVFFGYMPPEGPIEEPEETTYLKL